MTIPCIHFLKRFYRDFIFWIILTECGSVTEWEAVEMSSQDPATGYFYRLGIVVFRVSFFWLIYYCAAAVYAKRGSLIHSDREGKVVFWLPVVVTEFPVFVEPAAVNTARKNNIQHARHPHCETVDLVGRRPLLDPHWWRRPRVTHWLYSQPSLNREKERYEGGTAAAASGVFIAHSISSPIGSRWSC